MKNILDLLSNSQPQVKCFIVANEISTIIPWKEIARTQLNVVILRHTLS